MELVVLNCWVTETNDTPWASKISTILAKSESDRVAAAYGANYDRLVQTKKRYDPDNIFHLNQNIKP